ncbi:MAG: hypothetical protein M1826_000441 [Phylliscum demangeonii]|nr:MAG: hypothetical protein M1826_000441 [Phylliscum demangeonii]
MDPPENLINLDVIETHKENIQLLPGGRSARALASVFSPPSSRSSSLPTSSETSDVNGAIRLEFEDELLSISEADDPLDIYDRYIKWTLDAYPSAQATSQSKLLPLLERATKAFLTSPHFKNDPRYLRWWLHYIRLFSDAPRETFAFLARHSVGDGLALFYEEFAAWLESVGRWAQAEEVYNLGLDRQARPVERLNRKFAEFQHRAAVRGPAPDDEPSSPALPTVRPALMAKVDPFASAALPAEQSQAPTQAVQAGRSSVAASGRRKLEVFSDDNAPPPATGSSAAETTQGWESIGSLAHRKKENVMEPVPWAGETLKAGNAGAKPPKMMIFKDETSQSQASLEPKQPQHGSKKVNPRTGRVERVYVNLDAVYPRGIDGGEEMSFEELRASKRGLLNREWAEEVVAATKTTSLVLDLLEHELNVKNKPAPAVHPVAHAPGASTQELDLDKTIRIRRVSRPKKSKAMEIKSETQTVSESLRLVKTNLDSPSRTLSRRKSAAEPTMTLHTRAATDEIYDIFNQPLRTGGHLLGDPAAATASDGDEGEDDEEASGGESTGTGKISGPTSDGGQEEEDVAGDLTASEWSDFTTRKHLPDLDADDQDAGLEMTVNSLADNNSGVLTADDNNPETSAALDISTFSALGKTIIKPLYIPSPPADYEPPTGTYRDIISQSGLNRPLLMTPIVERTESSMAPTTMRDGGNRRETKTPSKEQADLDEAGYPTPDEDADDSSELVSSPFQEVINEALARHKQQPLHPVLTKSVKHKPEDVKAKTTPGRPADFPGDGLGHLASDLRAASIHERIVNPTDEAVRRMILKGIQPGLTSYDGFFDRQETKADKSNEIRKSVRALKTSAPKKASDAENGSGVGLHLEGSSREYRVRSELGKGAFAPVYLVESGPKLAGRDEEGNRKSLEALKMESPPSAWEFYIMRQASQRLRAHRARHSILPVHELHLFADECFLVEEYRDQGTLLDLVNASMHDDFFSAASNPSCSVASGGGGSSSSSGGALDECLVAFFTIELLRTVDALHRHGILHGDLKADNCLVRLELLASGSASDERWSRHYARDGSDGWSRKGISLIDFGRGIDMRCFPPLSSATASSATPRSIFHGFVADWPTTVQDPPEMRSGRPWTYQIDYWGLAGIVHTMLFGKYIVPVARPPDDHQLSDRKKGDGGLPPPPRYRPNERPKRYWAAVELWHDVFDVLLNPSAHVDPADGCGEVGVDVDDVDVDVDGGKAGGRDRDPDGRTTTRLLPHPISTAMRRLRVRLEDWLEMNAERGGLRNALRRWEERCGALGGVGRKTGRRA